MLRLAPTARNLKYAERLRAEILNSIERGTFDYLETFPNSAAAARFAVESGHGERLGDMLRAFLVGAERRVARSTFLDWRNSVQRVLIPTFGHLRAGQLRQSDVQAWIDGHDLTQKRIANILTPLRQVMEQARREERITRNPLADFRVRARQVDKQRRVARGDQVDPFTPAEIGAIVAELEPGAANYVVFAVWSGLRVEELIELRWTDVDTAAGLIRVRRARTRGEVKEPKTVAGRRDVALLEPARAALKAQEPLTKLQRGHVFHDPRTDAPYLGDKQFREWQWRPALVRAGVRYRAPRQLRHTFATWMVGAGENIKWTSRQMGHESTQMTLDTYADWIPDMNPDAGAKAAALWKITPPAARDA